MIPTAQATENDLVINWDFQKIGTETDVLTTSCIHIKPTQPEAAAIMQRLVQRAAKERCAPRHPSAKRQGEMIELAMEHGREIFLAAGREFLEEGQWVPANEKSEPAWDPWQPFCECFFVYADMYQDRLKREERARAEEAKRVREEYRRALERDLYGLLDIPANCPMLTDADRSHIQVLRAHYAHFRDVSRLSFNVADYRRSVELYARHIKFLTEEQRKKRAAEALQNDLTREKFRLWAMIEPLQDTEWYEENDFKYNDLYYSIRYAKTVDDLKPLAVEAQTLLAEIGFPRP